MDRGVWQATVHRATQSQKQLKRMSTIPHIHETNKNIHMIFSKVVKYLTKLNIMMEIFSKLLIEENIQSEKQHYKRISLLPGGSDGKTSAYIVGDLGSIPGWGRSPGEENGNTLQYSCLENPMDGGAWQAIVHGVAKSRI